MQEAAYDAELQLGLQAQKRLREQLLRQKEMRRQMQAQERRHDGTSHAQQQQQPATMAPVTGMSTVAATEFLKPYYRPLRAFSALTLLVGRVPGRSSGL